MATVRRGGWSFSWWSKKISFCTKRSFFTSYLLDRRPTATKNRPEQDIRPRYYNTSKEYIYKTQFYGILDVISLIFIPTFLCSRNFTSENFKWLRKTIYYGMPKACHIVRNYINWITVNSYCVLSDRSCLDKNIGKKMKFCMFSNISLYTRKPCCFSV